MSNENKQEAQKNNTAVMVALGAALVAGIMILVIALGSVFSDGSDGDDTTAYIISTGAESENAQQGDDDSNGGLIDNGVGEDTVADQNQGNGTGDGNGSGDGGSGNGDTGDSGNSKETKNEAVEYYEQLSPNGDNKLSDHYDNKYIKQVSSDYGVDTELLVAIYSVPDTGNNFVLQFTGDRNSDGNVIKSPDTLDKVYQIDEKGNVSIATGKQTGNVGVSYAEGMLCFNMVKTLVMTQYPEYFTGLE